MGATLTELSLKLSANSIELKQALDGARSDLSKFKNDVESKFSGVTKAFGLISGAALGAMGAFKTFEGVINSTGDSADAYEKRMKQAEFATTALFQRIVTGNFENLIQGLKDAADAGAKYADQLDEIQDRRRSLTVVEAQYRLEILKLKNDLAKETDKDKRVEIIDKIIAKEKELNETKTKISNQQYQAELKNLQLNNDFTQQQWENFVKNYNKEDELRKQAQVYNEQRQLAINIEGNDSFNNRLAKANTPEDQYRIFGGGALGTATDDIKMLASVLRAWGEKSDEVIDNYIKSFEGVITVQGEVYESTNKLEKMSTNLKNGLDEEGRKVEATQLKAINEELERQLSLSTMLYDTKDELYNDTQPHLTNTNDYYTSSGWDLNSGASWQNDPQVAGGEDVYEGSGQDYKVLDSIDRNKQRAQQFSDEVGFILSQGTADMIGNFAEGIGAMLAGDNVDFGKVILMGLVQMAEAVGRLAISLGLAVKALQTSLLASPMLAIVAGTALLVIAGAVKSSLSSAAKFADGGIVGGYSFSGDKVPAMVNSGEMILNSGQQSRLFKMLNSGTSTTSAAPQLVEFRIEGTQLVGVLNNQYRKANVY